MKKKHRIPDKNKIPGKEDWEHFAEDVNYNVHSYTFKRRIIAFSKLLLLVVILILIPTIIYLMFKDTYLSREYLADLPRILAEKKQYAFIFLLIFQILQIVICFIPGQPIQFASSYLYGVLGGYLISIVGALLGSLLTYLISRFLGRDALEILFGKEKVRSYVKKMNSGKSLVIIFLIYLIPGIPKDIISYIAGISDIDLTMFMVVSLAGRTPGLLGSLLLGAFWAKRNYVGMVIVSVICIVILYICIKKRRTLTDFIDKLESKKEEAH